MDISRRHLMALSAATIIAPVLPAAAKTPPLPFVYIEHLRLCEFGDLGPIGGGFAKGHIAAIDFARSFVATTDEDDLALMFGDEIFDEETGDLADEDGLIRSIARDVYHTHAEQEFLGKDEDANWQFHTYGQSGPGTFPATVLWLS